MRRLLRERVGRWLGPGPLVHDGALVEVSGGTAAFTTDSFVVSPLFFPGGDLGRLAVCGTANDLAMCGARPLALSLSLILEEGLPLETLDRLLQSVAETAEQAGVRVVTGDTKVVERGKADGVFMNTAGLGAPLPGARVHPRRLSAGDVILVTGDLGRHGMAVMAARSGLGLELDLPSDVAPVFPAIAALLERGIDLRCARDPTRGGLVSVLHEWAEASGLGAELDETAVPVCPEVAAAAELLGLDPWLLACEGRAVLAVPEAEVQAALDALRAVPVSAGAAVIGRLREGGGGPVIARGPWGTRRLVDLPDGELLPRIC